jgi:hypothetical protein
MLNSGLTRLRQRSLGGLGQSWALVLSSTLAFSLAANRLRWARWPPRWRVWSKL